MSNLAAGTLIYIGLGFVFATACLAIARRLRRTDLAWDLKNPGTLESDVLTAMTCGAVWPVALAFLVLSMFGEWMDGPKKPPGAK